MLLIVLKESILNYTENLSGCKIASIDAEKALDKVWRDGLFYKLINRLTPTIWNLLKTYYDSSKGTVTFDNLGLLSELISIKCS